MRKPVLFTTTDYPFYQFKGEWYYTHNMQRVGPFKTRDEAATSYRNELQLIEGVR